MNASHRRPLFAYVLVTVAGAVVVAQGLAMSGLPIPGFRLELDRDQQVAEGSLLTQKDAVEPREDTDGQSGRSALDDLVIDDETFADLDATPASVVTPAPTVSAAPQPDTSGGIHLVS